MSTEQADHIRNMHYHATNGESFWYCFDSYSDFFEIEDEEFHTLRKSFIDSGRKLENKIKRLMKIVENFESH